jgi:hypothetical protein
MRPVRIITTAGVVAVLAVTGCTSRTADQTTTPAPTAPSSVSTTQPTAAPTTRSTAGSAGSTATTVTVPATASCALSPNRGPAESRVTLSCRSFAPSEQVEVTFGATVLTTAKATVSGQVAASFAVPGGFAGSTIPGRKDTFQAKGRQSGKTASATYTVASPARASCVLAPTRGLAGSRVSLSCRGFAPAEQVVVAFGAEGLATAKATADGHVVASFEVPSGFAGSHYPGRKDTFLVKGRHSGRVASATFTVAG